MDLTTPAGATLMETLRLIDLASTENNRLLDHPMAALRLEQMLMLALLLTQPEQLLGGASKDAQEIGPQTDSPSSRTDPRTTRAPVDRY